MKIKKELIGSKVKSQILNRYFTIELGLEEFYIQIGLLHIFEPAESKIKMIKKDAETGKKSDKHTDSDSDRAEDSGESLLAL